jgi:hypothetical protein
MRSLPRPPFKAADVVAGCIAHMADGALKTSLESVGSELTAAELTYETRGNARDLYAMPQQLSLNGSISVADMIRLYANRFVRKRAPGRRTYDAIMTAAPYSRCPLCGLRTVSTLDHYLPKTLFASYVLAPLNLIPACSECNRLKRNWVASVATAQTLHPYFDNIEADRWLFADIQETSPPALSFSVSRPAVWDDLTFARVESHFRMFRLDALYASHAAEELVNIRLQLELLLERSGPEGVKAHLVEQTASRAAHNINSWQSATYEALAGSDWYCAGGFK